jgi:hypothetical protein
VLGTLGPRGAPESSSKSSRSNVTMLPSAIRQTRNWRKGDSKLGCPPLTRHTALKVLAFTQLRCFGAAGSEHELGPGLLRMTLLLDDLFPRTLAVIGGSFLAPDNLWSRLGA